MEVWLDYDEHLDIDQNEQRFCNAEFWARDFCESFKAHQVLWLETVSLKKPIQAVYVFGNDRDVMIFKLKWGGWID
jgi:hypothetical protein